MCTAGLTRTGRVREKKPLSMEYFFFIIFHTTKITYGKLYTYIDIYILLR